MAADQPFSQPSAAELLLLVDQLPQLVWTTDPAGSPLYFNRRWTEYTGLTTEQSLGPDVWNHTLHPDDQARARERWGHSLRTGEFYEIEYRFRRHDGVYRWFLGQAQPVRDADGRIVKWFGTCTDIHEQKTAEAERTQLLVELEAERTRLRTILAQFTEGIILTDPAGAITLVNGAAARLHGVERLDVKPEDYSRTYHLFTLSGEPYPFADLPLARAAQHDEVVTDALWIIRRPDGTEVVVQGSACPVFDPASGAKTGALLTIRDVTAARATEAALREREQQLDTLANNIPQLAWMADPTGHIFWYNRRWYAYTNTTFEEMEGWGWEKVHHPEHLARVVEKWSAALAAGTPWEDTFPLRGADGRYRWFLSRAEPIRDADGRILRWFGTNTDVTEQRLLQDQLRSAYADLETKVTFRTLELERELTRLRESKQ